MTIIDKVLPEYVFHSEIKTKFTEVRSHADSNSDFTIDSSHIFFKGVIYLLKNSYNVLPHILLVQWQQKCQTTQRRLFVLAARP